MFDLYEQGLGIHAIANKTGRSTHTVHSVLTQRGTRPPGKGLIAVPVEVAGVGGAENGKTTRRLIGSRT